MTSTHNSYKKIVKSTSIVGGSQVISVFFRILRSKALAILIGPSGIGLMGAYTSLTSMVQSITGLGIGFSAVRQIAQANATNDQKIIARSILTLRRAALFTGLVGTVICFILSEQLSVWTFKSAAYSLGIKLLSVVIFLNILSGAQSALIQGLRRIKELAKLTIWGAVWGTVLSIPIVYFWGIKGVVYFIIAIGVMQLVTSWWYARKIKIVPVELNFKEFLQESKGFVTLGIAFTAGGLASAATNYLIRIIIIHEISLEALGWYQAAFALSNLYIGLILDAMGKDFYPRLTEVSNDSKQMIQVINEQIEVGFLLAVPGLIFTIIVAPFLINIFYSSEFIIAEKILRWSILGVLIRVIVWPIAYNFLARAKGKWFLGTELIFDLIYIGLVVYFIHIWGIVGAGIAFFVLYIFYLAIIFLIAKSHFGFYLFRKVWKTLIRFLIPVSLVFLISMQITNIYGLIINLLIGIGMSYFALKKIVALLELGSFRQLISVFKGKLIK